MSIQTTRRGKWREQSSTPTEWCEEHGLIPALTPLPHRTVDSWDVVETVGEFIESLPSTAATFAQSQLLDGSDAKVAGRHRIIRAALLLHGAWPLERSTDSLRWVNPEYQHQRAIAPGRWDDRDEHLTECARLGTLTREDVAPRFDVTRGSLARWLTRNRFPWSQIRSEGIRNLARTLVVATHWTDRGQRSLARLLPRPEGTVRSWISKHATSTDWEVPEHPEVYWIDD